MTVDELKHQIHRCQPDKNDVRMMCRVFFFMFSYRILIFCVQKFHLRFTKTRIGQLSLSEIFVSVRIISCFVCFVCVARMCLYRYIQYTVYVSGNSTQTHVSIISFKEKKRKKKYFLEFYANEMALEINLNCESVLQNLLWQHLRLFRFL